MPTRPALSWSDLAGASVGVWGLGIEGTANLQCLADLGADVVVVEDSPSQATALGHEVLTLDQGGLEALAAREVVVKTPGIARNRPEVGRLEAEAIPVVGGLGLWMQEAPLDRVLAITGTKGKSTTTAIAGHLLERLGYATLVGGNIGRAPYDPAQPAGYDFAVIEVSSYQATDLAVSPPVVAVTSLHPDHLDWHGGVEAYYRDKLSACTQPGAELTIADGASPELRAHAASLGPRVRWVTGTEADLDGAYVDVLGLPGAHSRRNALIARACLLALGVAEAAVEGKLEGAAAGFEALESRLRAIGRLGAVTFVDDSLSTNVLPTLAALDAYESDRVALIVGGHDRGIDYEPLARALAERSRRPGAGLVAVFTLPENGGRIGAAIRDEAGEDAEVSDCATLEEAVRSAYGRLGDGGGVVLLSPAASSFGQFRNYADRSAAFAAAMERCGRPQRPPTAAGRGRSGSGRRRGRAQP